MTAAALASPAAPRESTRPGLARLTAVELRKMVDTRAGLWLQLGVLALAVLAVVIRSATGDPADHVFRAELGWALQPVAYLLPVVGILLVTSEWTQRTALVTFTLVPQRSRVLAAKLAASAVLSVVALAACLVIAAGATLVAGSGVDGTWSLSAGLLGQDAVYLTSSMIQGLAFGTALLHSAPAIVAYFILPLGWSAAGTLSFLEGAANWLDASQTMASGPMWERLLTADGWARVGATLAVWMALPLVIGAWRILRGEVRV